MPRLDPQSVWRKILLNPRQSCKARLEALDHLHRPSVDMLRGLLSKPTTPPRLQVAAARRYELEFARKELMNAEPKRT
jgi:hypothetical protein